MSERIKKLAKQAYEDIIKNTPSFLVTKELYEQKFAELIVRECAEYVDTLLGDVDNPHYPDGEMVKEHFGIEE